MTRNFLNKKARSYTGTAPSVHIQISKIVSNFFQLPFRQVSYWIACSALPLSQLRVNPGAKGRDRIWGGDKQPHLDTCTCTGHLNPSKIWRNRSLHLSPRSVARITGRPEGFKARAVIRMPWDLSTLCSNEGIMMWMATNWIPPALVDHFFSVHCMFLLTTLSGVQSLNNRKKVL